jgi:hypothetical protein
MRISDERRTYLRAGRQQLALPAGERQEPRVAPQKKWWTFTMVLTAQVRKAY